MGDTISKPSAGAVTELAQKAIQHLEKESVVLQQFIDVCRKIRNNLGIQDDSEIETLKKEQEKIQAESNGISHHRLELRTAIAGALGRQVEATSIRSLEDHLDEDTTRQIGSLRDRIETQVKEIQELSHTNAILLQNNIDIFRRLILSVNGQDAKCQTYSATGQLSSPMVKVPVAVSPNS